MSMCKPDERHEALSRLRGGGWVVGLDTLANVRWGCCAGGGDGGGKEAGRSRSVAPMKYRFGPPEVCNKVVRKETSPRSRESVVGTTEEGGGWYQSPHRKWCMPLHSL
jgi:hypothetical protein